MNPVKSINMHFDNRRRNQGGPKTVFNNTYHFQSVLAHSNFFLGDPTKFLLQRNAIVLSCL